MRTAFQITDIAGQCAVKVGQRQAVGAKGLTILHTAGSFCAGLADFRLIAALCSKGQRQTAAIQHGTDRKDDCL